MKNVMVFILLAAVTFARAGEQKLILEKADNPRFDENEYLAPLENHGDAHVCMWENDKEAAFTFTIDGNWAGNHNFWIAAMDSFGLPVTFFVITHKVGTDIWSPWDSVIALYQKGHDIQSHSCTHGNGLWQYVASKDSIQSAMPFHTCNNIAYPGGSGTTPYPDSAVMAGYNGMRGVVSKPNPIARTNYLNVNSSSTWSERRVWGTLDPDTLIYDKSYRYGWVSFHMHSFNVTNEGAEILNRLRFLKGLEDRLWTGKYSSISHYGQERDTHVLTVTGVTDDEVRFTLTDDMNDSVFAYPLTVKVHVSGWDSVLAEQGGAPVEAELKTDSLGTYALVKAVPDQGEVVLSSGRTSYISQAPAVIVPAGNADGVLYDLRGTRNSTARQGMYLRYDPATGAVRKTLILE